MFNVCKRQEQDGAEHILPLSTLLAMDCMSLVSRLGALEASSRAHLSLF